MRFLKIMGFIGVALMALVLSRKPAICLESGGGFAEGVKILTPRFVG